MTAPFSDDPGWGSARSILWALVPVRGLRRPSGNGLVQLRTVFIAFAISLLCVGGVAFLIAASDDGTSSVDPLAAAAGVGVVGAVCVVASRTLGGPLRASTPEELAASYRTRFFLRFACADAAALVGLVAVIMSGSPVPYVVGLLWAAVGFAGLAPTAANLARDQEELNLQGCPYRLVDVLQAPVPAN